MSSPWRRIGLERATGQARIDDENTDEVVLAGTVWPLSSEKAAASNEIWIAVATAAEPN